MSKKKTPDLTAAEVEHLQHTAEQKRESAFGERKPAAFEEEETLRLEQEYNDHPFNSMMEEYVGSDPQEDRIKVNHYEHPDDFGNLYTKDMDLQKTSLHEGNDVARLDTDSDVEKETDAYNDDYVATIAPKAYTRLKEKGYIAAWKENGISISESQIAQYMAAKEELKNLGKRKKAANYTDQFNKDDYHHQDIPHPGTRHVAKLRDVALFSDEAMGGPIIPIRMEIQNTINDAIRMESKNAGYSASSSMIMR